MTETLYTCPKCGRANFTARGLTAHRCKPVTTLMAKNTPTTSIVTVDFSRAREHARAVEQAANQALWHAIQCGLELIRLKAAHPDQPGRRTDLTSPHAVERLNWDDLVRQEVGITDETARRWMLLAKGALKELETEPQEFLALPEPKREKTLEKVETLANQYATQQDFIRKLFGVKPPLGAGLAESGRQGGNQHGKGTGKDKTPKPMDPKLEADTLKKGINKDISDILNGKKKLWLHLSRTDMEVLQGQAKKLYDFMTVVLKGGH